MVQAEAVLVFASVNLIQSPRKCIEARIFYDQRLRDNAYQATIPIALTASHRLNKRLCVSYDTGDISWGVPTMMIYTTACIVGTSLGSWQSISQGKSRLAHKGMIHVAKVLASPIIKLLQSP